MPIHDWKRVDANIYHEFHQVWAMKIHDALNDGLLPPGYSALVEQHASGLVPDVLAVQRRSRERKHPSGGGVLTATPPKTMHYVENKLDMLAARASRVVVRHRLGDVVCVIEITSPGNKTSQQKMQEFVGKVIGYLQAGVNLLIVDLLPPSKRDPEGIHKAIWDEIASADIEDERPAGKPLTLAAYVSGDSLVDHPVRAYLEYVAIGDSLADMPAYLDDDSYVPVPLEATYTKAWNSCPADMRYLVEYGKLPED